MAPVLSPKEKTAPERIDFRYRGTRELLVEVDAAAAELGLSRNEAMTQLLRFALEAHRKDGRKAKK